MNISVTMDCTPEEARRLMGLPDLAPLHELYLDQLRASMTEGVTPEAFERLIRTWSPLGEAGLNAWRSMLEQVTGPGK